MEKRSFKLSRAMGEASLVNVARRASVEGVWLYQKDLFRDISRQQDRTKASFTVKLKNRSPFTVYHIHPAKEGTPGGFIDMHKGYKISPPSLEDLDSYVKIHRTFGEIASCKVADGWGVWSFALTPEALDQKEIATFTDKIIHLWLREGWIRDYKFRLNVTREQKRSFRARMLTHGIILDYETRDELYGRVIPTK